MDLLVISIWDTVSALQFSERAIVERMYGEIRAIETGEADREDNVLKLAPHTAQDLLADSWDRSYSRENASPCRGDIPFLLPSLFSLIRALSAHPRSITLEMPIRPPS